MSWKPCHRWLAGLAAVLSLVGCEQGRRPAVEPVGLQVTAASSAVPLGRSTTLVARAFTVDGAVLDVTDRVQWISTAPWVATVALDPSGLCVADSVAEGGTTLLARLPGSGLEHAVPLAVLPPVLDAVEVTPGLPSIALGTTQQFVATGVYSDASTQDLTDEVAWSSDVPTVASVDASGQATSLQVGAAGITATEPTSGVVGGATLTVTSAVLVSLAVTPSNPSIALGTTQQFVATGTFSDATTQDLTTQVAWSCADTAVATVSNAGGSEGLAASVGQGSTSVSALHAGTGTTANTTLTVTAAVLVSLAVTPSNPSIALGSTRQFAATGTYSDGTTQDLTASVAWSSTDTGVATVSNAGGSEGLASSVAQGATTVAATHSGTGISGSTTLTVTPAVLVSLAVMPASPTIAQSTTQQFSATGTYSDASTQDLTASVTWSSTDTGVATVSNAGGSEGLASGIAPGTATIGAADPGTGLSGSASLTVSSATLVSIAVTPAAPSIALGLTQQFTATGTYSDASTQDLTSLVTWSSTDTGVATVSNAGGSQGLATSVATGATTISALHPGSGLSGDTVLTVSPATLVSLAVTPGSASVVLGGTRQFAATGTYSDSSTQDLTTSVTWSSTDTGVATVSNAGGSQGLATSVAAGTTTIVALHPGSGLSDGASLTVLDDIALRGASQATGGTSIVVATPAGAVEGDVMLAAVTVRPDSVTITPPAGWTLVRRSDNGANVSNSLAVYVKVVGAAQPASEAWGTSNGTGAVVGVVAFAGVDTADPVDVHGGQTTASGLSHAAPSVTTSVAGAMLFTAHGFASAAFWTPPAGMTEVVDQASTPPPASTGLSVECNYELLGAAGATGARTAVASANDDVGNGIAVALRPAQ